MAAADASGAARLRMMCSHGGRFLPCGPGCAIRYVGGETRVLVVPREVSFRELSGKLGEMAIGKIVSAVRYRLTDDDSVLVSVTCDEELAHMCDEYDRLKSTRPSASFRVFFSGVDVQRRAASGRPPLPPKMRRVQSEPALTAPARARVHRGAALRLRQAPPLLLRLQPPPRPVPADARRSAHRPIRPRTFKVRSKNLIPWQQCPRTQMVRTRPRTCPCGVSGGGNDEDGE
ncbi:unnamed protein product [Alopecurus aequalis]